MIRGRSALKEGKKLKNCPKGAVEVGGKEGEGA